MTARIRYALNPGSNGSNLLVNKRLHLLHR